MEVERSLVCAHADTDCSTATLLTGVIAIAVALSDALIARTAWVKERIRQGMLELSRAGIGLERR